MGMCACLKAMLDMAKEDMYHGSELHQDAEFYKIYISKWSSDYLPYTRMYISQDFFFLLSLPNG